MGVGPGFKHLRARNSGIGNRQDDQLSFASGVGEKRRPLGDSTHQASAQAVNALPSLLE